MHTIKYGDFGIFAPKIKCRDINNAYAYLSTKANLTISDIQKDPAQNQHFWVKDNFGNCFNVVQGYEWFKHSLAKTGVVTGAVIGVSDIEKAIPFYSNFLGIAEVVYDVNGIYSDNDFCKKINCRRVLLRKKVTEKCVFNKLLGAVEIELVQSFEGDSNKIFNDTFWGDCGFIHLCFDVLNMDGLKKHASSMGIKFTVDSNESFAMDNASGRFCYAEDPHGTLIELVETHKIPIFKKTWVLPKPKKA